jgi:CHAD domain-containing protein
LAAELIRLRAAVKFDSGFASARPRNKASVAEFARFLVGHPLEQLLNGQEAQAGNDPEALHDFRVTMRRLRSNLRTFAPLFDRTFADELRLDLRWLGEETGGARDIDVVGVVLRTHASRIPVHDNEALARLFDELARQRATERARLAVALSSTRYSRLIETPVDAVRCERPRRPTSSPDHVSARAEVGAPTVHGADIVGLRSIE